MSTETVGIRKAISLLPPCATTGIGSLPHTQLELGLQVALQVDIPYLPQLPIGVPGEFMIPSALEGFPGAVADKDGMGLVDADVWQREREPFVARVEAALQRDELSDFEPSQSGNRAWRPFLWEVEHRRLALAKAQIAGPATVRWVAKTTDGRPVSDLVQLDQDLLQFLLAKTLALAKALRRAGATPLVYLDEPGLYAYERGNPKHLVTAQELKLVVAALHRAGALVGLHCCSNTDWAMALGLGVDLLALDVRLSLDAMLEEKEAFAAYLASGATLSLGIIPTDLASTYEVKTLVDSVEASLCAELGEQQFRDVISHGVLTPACGLAMRSVPDCERIFEQLREAQALLRERIRR